MPSPTLQSPLTTSSPRNKSPSSPTCEPPLGDTTVTPKLLVRAGTDWASTEPSCPTAKTLFAKDENAGYLVLIQITCRRWGCPYCGPLKVKRLAAQNVAAKPTRLVTLTVDPKLWDSPLDAWKRTSQCVSRLAQKLRRSHGEFEFCRVTEATRKGWPHYHLVVRSGFIQWTTIRDEWRALTGATIVDVRKIKDALDINRYIVKYLAKQEHIPWTNRRVSCTRRYVPADFNTARPSKRSLSLPSYHRYHPLRYADEVLQDFTLERISANVWKCDPPPVDDFPLA